MKVKDINRVDRVLKAIDKLQSGYVTVGILGKAGSEILLIAGVNEYGCSIKVTPKMRGFLGSQGLHLKKTTTEIKIPERSFIRSSFDENIEKIATKMEKLMIDVVELKISPDTFFNALGKESVAAIQKHMRELSSPRNHPLTISKKGSSNPLINTGRLIQSIDYEIKYK